MGKIINFELNTCSQKKIGKEFVEVTTNEKVELYVDYQASKEKIQAVFSSFLKKVKKPTFSFFPSRLDILFSEELGSGFGVSTAVTHNLWVVTNSNEEFTYRLKVTGDAVPSQETGKEWEALFSHLVNRIFEEKEASVKPY